MGVFSYKRHSPENSSLSAYELVPDKSAVFKFMNFDLTKYSTINYVDEKVNIKSRI